MSETASRATRERLLEAAREQFAARGFHGASLAQIAGELGVTKQALLYHFRCKEDLYAEVLKGISERLLGAVREGEASDAPPPERFARALIAIQQSAGENHLDTRVLMRELLDNQRREAPEEEWYLKTFLDHLVEALDGIGNWKQRSHAEKIARIYLLISAAEYFAASGAVLARFYGESGYAEIEREVHADLRAQVRRLVEEGESN